MPNNHDPLTLFLDRLFDEILAPAADELIDHFMQQERERRAPRSRHSPPRDVQDRKRRTRGIKDPRHNPIYARKSTAYDVLGVASSAPVEVIAAAHKALAKTWHPDFAGAGAAAKSKAEMRMKLINAAYDVLADPEKRKAYDRSIGLGL